MRMDSRDRKILLASIVEVREAYHEAMNPLYGSNLIAAEMLHLLSLERLERWELGEYATTGNSGVAEDSSGGE